MKTPQGPQCQVTQLIGKSRHLQSYTPVQNQQSWPSCSPSATCFPASDPLCSIQSCFPLLLTCEELLWSGCSRAPTIFALRSTSLQPPQAVFYTWHLKSLVTLEGFKINTFKFRDLVPADVKKCLGRTELRENVNKGAIFEVPQKLHHVLVFQLPVDQNLLLNFGFRTSLLLEHLLVDHLVCTGFPCWAVRHQEYFGKPPGSQQSPDLKLLPRLLVHNSWWHQSWRLLISCGAPGGRNCHHFAHDCRWREKACTREQFFSFE